MNHDDIFRLVMLAMIATFLPKSIENLFFGVLRDT